MEVPHVINCKCHAFVSWPSILDFVESDDKSQVLETWLNDDEYDEQHHRHASHTSQHHSSAIKVRCHEFRWSSISHHKHSIQRNCMNRRAAAIFIVQNIRDASNHVANASDLAAVQDNNNTSTKNNTVKYEESFPTLIHSNINMEKPTLLLARKKNNHHKASRTAPISQAPIANLTVSNISQSNINSNHKETAIMNRAMKPSSSTTMPNSSISHQEKNPWGHKSDTPIAQVVRISEDIHECMLQRLVSIYSIILHRHLVPSSVVEIQFLLSLLSSPYMDRDPSQNQSSNSVSSPSLPLQRLFFSPSYSRHFAVKVFIKIIPTLLWKWGPHFIHNLIHVPSFSCHVPYEQRNYLYQMWNNIIRDTQQTPTTPGKKNQSSLYSTDSVLPTSIQFFFLQNQQLDSHIGQVHDIRAWKEASSDMNSLGAFTETHPFLTLPFDEKRDSKHLYKSKELTSLFQNREQCRDSFLYLLRSFQKVKGSLLDPHQMDQFMHESRVGSKDVIQSLFPTNLSWFAEFFSDLLLQIGLSAMQETDVDILSHISDQDKIQKLHKRFTAKAPTKSKHRSTSGQHNPQAVRSNDKCSAHIQYEYLFPGHQEFFYHFLTWIDSHSFACHLQNRLQHSLISLNKQQMDSSCHLLVAKLCLVSRFLGFLNFYPWLYDHQDKAQDKIALNSCNIPLLELIGEAWVGCRLNIVIPWVVDFLRMMVWNEQSLRSIYFMKVFGMLRSIQVTISRYESSGSQLLQSNRYILSLFLESLFNFIVVPADIDTCSFFALPPTVMNKGKYLPEYVDLIYPFIFSKPLLSLSSSHMDDLMKTMVQMITNPNQTLSHPLTGTSKKLKPLSISQEPSPPDVNKGNVRDVKTKIEDQTLVTIHKTLAAAFFHHHKEVEQISRFISNQYVKSLLSYFLKLFSPIIDAYLDSLNFENTVVSTPLDSDYYALVAQQVEDQVQCRMIRMADKDCDTYIISSIRTLTKSTASARYVCRISSAITASETKNTYKSLLLSLIRSEIKRKVDDFAQRSKKMQHQGERTIDRSGPGPFSLLERITEILGEIQRNSFNFNRDSLRELGRELASLNDMAFEQRRRSFVLKKLYSSSLDLLLSELVNLLENSHLCTNHQFRTDRMFDSFCFIDLGSLSQIVRFVLQVRILGYRSKEISVLLSMLSSTKVVENLVLTIDDSRYRLMDLSAHTRSGYRNLSYCNIHDINSVLFDLIENQMLSKCRLNQNLRNLLIHSSSQLVAIRCVGLLGLAKCIPTHRIATSCDDE